MALPRRRPRDPEGRMPLGEHLRELRQRIVKSGITLLIATAFGWFVYDPVIEDLLKPYKDYEDAPAFDVERNRWNWPYCVAAEDGLTIDPENLRPVAEHLQAKWPEAASSYQYEEETNRIYDWTTYNPNSRWDWWVVGGRWTGYMPLKAGAQVTAEDIVKHCRQHLAGFKVPRAVVFGELPKTSTGKIQKFELRKQAGSAAAIDV